MEDRISKSKLKPRLLEVFRRVEETGSAVVVTDRGRPVLRIVPYRERDADARALLRGSVREYRDPLDPVGDEDWEAAS